MRRWTHNIVETYFLSFFACFTSLISDVIMAPAQTASATGRVVVTRGSALTEKRRWRTGQAATAAHVVRVNQSAHMYRDPLRSYSPQLLPLGRSSPPPSPMQILPTITCAAVIQSGAPSFETRVQLGPICFRLLVAAPTGRTTTINAAGDAAFERSQKKKPRNSIETDK